MERFYRKQYKDKEILCLDLSDYNAKEKEALNKNVEEAKKAIKKCPPKSALLITNVTKTGFDSDISSVIKDYAKHNTPYVKASALVGVSGLQKVILAGIKRITGRMSVPGTTRIMSNRVELQL